ncbi:MAG: GIY-YIG nuclease family protein [Methanosarcinaceae archaeon]|nr:GIY-YIG nuclease family protein [Methanosarcinaceae archaeon]
MSKPYSIKIFLPGGDPDGLRIIEKSNWSGVGLVIPRPLFGAGKQRKEIARTGVYVLFGPPEESGLPRVYVGEGDPIRPRLEQHAAKKDFWTSCIAFTSKDENLNKAHVQYLEARLIALATQSKRCVLDNGNAPTLPSLSEADAADSEGFLAEMLLCFPVLGLGVFSTPSSVKVPGKTLYLAAKGVRAQGVERAGGFVVKAGSGAVKTEVPSCHAYLKELRAALVKNGALKISGDGYTFAQDYVFTSPSTAAGVVLGRSVNGRIEWQTKDGKTLKHIQETEAIG